MEINADADADGKNNKQSCQSECADKAIRIASEHRPYGLLIGLAEVRWFTDNGYR